MNHFSMSDTAVEDKGGGSDNHLEDNVEEPQNDANIEHKVSTTASIISEIAPKSPDFDERELEDIQLNDKSEYPNESTERYSPLPKYTSYLPDDETSNNVEDNESLSTPVTETAVEKDVKVETTEDVNIFYFLLYKNINNFSTG